MKAVLLDTGVVVALLDRSERLHPACAEAVESLTAPLITCEAVIAESCHLYPCVSASRGGSVGECCPRQDFADACLVHLAGELGTGDILTLDRDFEFYRWGTGRRFRLLPHGTTM